MSERKYVIIQPPFEPVDGFAGRIETLCFLHSVYITIEWHNNKPVMTLALTEDSHDLPAFASEMARYITGPPDKLDALVRDLSTLEFTAYVTQ